MKQKRRNLNLLKSNKKITKTKNIKKNARKYEIDPKKKMITELCNSPHKKRERGNVQMWISKGVNTTRK